MNPPLRATVIIVNYNGAHLLDACLDALAAQAQDAPPFETVVVDNASTDGSLDLLARDYPWVRVLASDDNRGFAGGNNLALRQVTTPYAVLLNNDAAPERGWLRNLLEPFERPGGHDIAITTSKILFLPKFARMQLRTPGFLPGTHDTRDLGVRVYRVVVDDADVTDKVLWRGAAYGAEGSGSGRFRWTRPEGEFLVPLPPQEIGDDHTLGVPTAVVFTVAAESPKSLTLAVEGQQLDALVGTRGRDVEFELKPSTELVDVVNNAGGIVLIDGSGADRGFQEIDEGQYDERVEVFNACGNGMALRTAVGSELGWFDDTFFMYYEDTDLSWRWRSYGWSIEYVPSAVLRHIHSASSQEWSPRWTFYVERNRLLMLTKNATAGLAARAVWYFVRSSAANAARAVRDSMPRRPAVRSHALRARILLSYIRLAPHALRERARIRRTAVIPADQLQQWLVTRS